MVRQRLLRRYRGDDIADGGDVRREVAAELAVRQLRERAGLEPFVVIGDIDRKQAPNVRQVDRAPDWLTQDLDAQTPVPPAADRIHEIEFSRIFFLAEQMYLVAAVN